MLALYGDGMVWCSLRYGKPAVDSSCCTLETSGVVKIGSWKVLEWVKIDS